MAKPHLKNLPPDERISQARELLKKLETEKDKGKKEKQKPEELKKLAQEAEELQETIHEAEEEIRGQRKWKEKVPIAEAIKEELEGLSEEGREVVRALRGIQQRKPEDQEELLKSKKREPNLEETVWQEKKELPPEARGVQYGPSQQQMGGVEYGARSQKPLADLYQEASALKHSVEDKGYISRADERRAEYLTAVVQERLQAAEEGTYSLSEQAARAASLTQMIGENIQQSYRGRRGNSLYQA